MDNVVYLVAADESLTRKQLKGIAKQATANFKDMGLKTEVKIFKGKFNKNSYGKLDKTDAVAVIGNKANVVKTVASFNEAAGREISSFGDKGNPEQSQNPRGSTVQSDGNIIAIGTEATKDMAKLANETVEESAAFLINHGAGHNADLNHASDDNGYDDQGKYRRDGIYVPGSPNVMSGGNTLIYSPNSLHSFITSPVNQQPANNAQHTLSIRAAFINRFGNNTPNATLPTTTQ